MTSVACPAANLCLAGDDEGKIFASELPLGAPSTWQVKATGLGGYVALLDCPSTTFCFAGIAQKNAPPYRILVSTDPTGGRAAWHAQRTERSSISCPSASLCVAVQNRDIDTTLNPAAGSATAWNTTPIATSGTLTGVSCASTSFCAVTTSAGSVYVSSNPAAGKSAWKRASADPGIGLAGPTCPSRSFCAALDAQGTAVYSANPAGGTPTWHVVTVPRKITGLACLSASFCYARGGRNSDLYTTTEIEGGVVRWLATDAGLGSQLGSASCVTPDFCAAVAGPLSLEDWVYVSGDPTGGPSDWNTSEIDGYNSILAIDCPDQSLCVAGDDAGNIVTSTNPAGGAASWHVVNADHDYRIDVISCPSEQLCMAADSTGELLWSTEPTGGASAWHAVGLNAATRITSIACPSPSLCVAGGSGGTIWTSSQPTGGSEDWLPATIGSPNDNMYVSCPETSLCVSAGQTTIYTSANPAGGASSWHKRAVFHLAAGIGPIACPAASLCVAAAVNYLDPGYAPVVLSSTQPTSGRKAWQSVSVGPATIPGPGLGLLSCPTTALCLLGVNGSLFISASPAAASSQDWTPADATASALACPTSSLCLAGTQHGQIQAGQVS